jgi:hypothetical protein
LNVSWLIATTTTFSGPPPRPSRAAPEIFSEIFYTRNRRTASMFRRMKMAADEHVGNVDYRFRNQNGLEICTSASLEKPMGEAPKIQSGELSRRSILRNLATGASGAAVLATGVAGSRMAEAQTKATQKAVGYQDTPKGAQRCDNCRQFEPPSSCKTVEGTVAPAGWCKVYVKKPA